LEPVLHGVFEEFRPECAVTPPPFPRIPFDEAVLKYGSDKPDLRNPLAIRDVTAAFRDSGFAVFATAIAGGAVVRAVRAPQGAAQPRSFFDKLTQWARAEGGPGLGYVTLAEGGARGPIAKFLEAPHLGRLRAATEAIDGDVLFFVCEQRPAADRLAGKVRNKLGEELGLIEKHAFRFCWVTDFPMYELNEETGKIEFSHNPFSMPQGGMEALETKDPLTIKAYQYDVVCNGTELSSGAVRNHKPEIMYKAFAVAGHAPDVVDQKFGGMIRAFKFGAPPHAGIAPGIDRIVMLLAEQSNIREIIAFPLNQRGQDLLMNAPAEVLDKQLRDVHI